MQTTLTTTLTKTCNKCGRALPLDRFRRHRKGSEIRHSECQDCFNQYMRVFNARRRGKAIRKFARDLRREQSWGRAAGLVNAMLTRFGGVDRFAAAWAGMIRQAQGDRASAKAVLESLQAIMRLFELCHHESPEPDVSEMTDEQLQEAMLRAAEQACLNHPELAIAAAQRLGWKVEPPPEAF